MGRGRLARVRLPVQLQLVPGGQDEGLFLAVPRGPLPEAGSNMDTASQHSGEGEGEGEGAPSLRAEVTVFLTPLLLPYPRTPITMNP